MLSEDFESNLNSLRNMGFSEETSLSALRMSKNDVNIAISYLTGELTGLLDSNNQNELNGNGHTNGSEDVIIEDPSDESSDEGFPEFAFKKLGNLLRRGTPIFYKEGEPLDKCLKAAMEMYESGVFLESEDCIEFCERMLPEITSRMVNANEVVQLDNERVKSVHTACRSIITIIVRRFRYLPASGGVGRMLGEILCIENRFNKLTRDWPIINENDLDLHFVDYAAIKNTHHPYGALVDLLEHFGNEGGFRNICSHFEAPRSNFTIEDAFHLMCPLGASAQYLQPSAITSIVVEAANFIKRIVEGMSDKMIRDAGIRFNIKLLITEVERLSTFASSFPVGGISFEQCRLDFLLKCLKSSQLDAKMYALSELGEIVCAYELKNGENVQFNDWLKSNGILDAVLGGNMDQTAYVDKIKPILSYMAKFFNDKDIQYVWSLRKGRMGVSGDNFGQLLLYVAIGFDLKQTETLIGFWNKSFQANETRMMDRIFIFCRDIGKMARKPEISEKMVFTMWNLILLARQFDHPLMNAVVYHAELIETLRRGLLREKYIREIVDIVVKRKDPSHLLTNIHHLRALLNIPERITIPGPLHFTSSSIMTRRQANGFHEQRWDTAFSSFAASCVFNQNFIFFDDDDLDFTRIDRCWVLIRESHMADTLSEELLHARKIAHERFSNLGHYVIPADESRDGCGETSTDPCMITIHENLEYGKVLNMIFNMLSYINDKKIENFTWARHDRLWRALVEDDSSSAQERVFYFEWLTQLSIDDEIMKLFLHQMCNVDVRKINTSAFVFLDNVVKKLHRVEDLPVGQRSIRDIGFDLLWNILLEADEIDIVNQATTKLISSHTTLEKDVTEEQRHQKFLEQCNNKLDILRKVYFDRQGKQASPGALLKRIEEINTDGSEETTVVDRATRWLKKVERLPDNHLIRCIERILRLIADYVEQGDDRVMTERMSLAHGSSYFGNPVDIFIKYGDSGSERSYYEVKTHSKETIFVLKTRIQHRLGIKNLRAVSLYRLVPHPETDRIREIPVPNTHDWKTLEQLEICFPSERKGLIFHSRVDLLVKNKSLFNLKELRSDILVETSLPGQMITKANGVFDMLHQLLSIPSQPVRAASRRLLSLIPTSPHDNIFFSTLAMDPSSGPQRLLNHLDVTQPYRLLYGLEEIYARILPIKWADEHAFRKAEQTVINLINCGITDILLRILTVPQLLPPIPFEDRMCIFELSHHILSFLLIDESRCRLQIVNEKKAADAVPTIKYSNMRMYSHIEKLSPERSLDVIRKLRQYVWNVVGGWMRQPGITSRDASQPIFCQSDSSQDDVGCSFWAGGDGHGFAQSPHANIISEQQHPLSDREILLARESVHLLLALANRYSIEGATQSVNVWTTVWCDPECVMFWTDIIVNASNRRYIRLAALRDIDRMDLLKDDVTMRAKLLAMLGQMRNNLPFWEVRGDKKHTALQCRQRLQCHAFFTLLSSAIQWEHDDNVLRYSFGETNEEMLYNEAAWLTKFRPAGEEMVKEELAVASGHITLLSMLVVNMPQHQTELGEKLIEPIFSQCLFSHETPQQVAIPTTSRFLCALNDADVRHNALNLIADLCKESTENVLRVIRWLSNINRHVDIGGWQYECTTTGRQLDHVGLKNDGGTCYMNSVLQQLFFIPHVLERCVAIKDVDPKVQFDGAKGALLHQLQRMFAHLAFSKKEYYVPRGFWETFRFFDEDSLDTKQQHDAVDFFTAVVDKIDTVLEKLKRPLLFKPILGGKFSYEYICYGCWHRYTGRDEEFVCVNLELHGETLEECFEHYVDGEILEGENAYNCEKCAEKRSTLRRGSFKALPDTLTIQLKRFSYDYTGRQAKKNDQFCQFPESLDMTPFTSDSRMVSENELEDLFEAVCESSQGPSVHKTPVAGSLPINSPSIRLSSGASPAPSPTNSFSRLSSAKQKRRRISTIKSSEEYHYELVGVLAHHGLAAAGHYYSYIKERRDETVSSYWHGRWLETNDTKITEFNGEERERAEQWFGGNFREERIRANSFNGNVELPSERTRTWNAYVLFYDRVKDDVTEKRGGGELFRMSLNEEEEQKSDDSSSLDKMKEIFESMPQGLITEVNNANLTFLREKALYCSDYITTCNKFTKHFIAQMKEAKANAGLDDVNLRHLDEVSQFYMWWCIHVLWRLPEDLTANKLIYDSMCIICELIKVDRRTTHTLARLFLDINESSRERDKYLKDICKTYIQETMASPNMELRYNFWDKLANPFVRAMSEELQSKNEYPEALKDSHLNSILVHILRHLEEAMPLHRIRAEIGLEFLRRYVVNNTWRMRHLLAAGGLLLLHRLIHTGGEESTETDYVAMLDEATSKKTMYHLFYDLLSACSQLEPMPKEWLQTYRNSSYWRVAIEGLAYHDTKDHEYRTKFIYFASSLIRMTDGYGFYFVDGVSCAFENVTGINNLSKLFLLIFEIDQDLQINGEFVRNCFEHPGDRRIGLFSRLARWKQRNVLKASEFVAAFDKAVGQCNDILESIQPIIQQIDTCRTQIDEQNLTLDLTRTSDQYELPSTASPIHDDDDDDSNESSMAFLKGEGVPETLSINDIPCIAKERSEENPRDDDRISDVIDTSGSSTSQQSDIN